MIQLTGRHQLEGWQQKSANHPSGALPSRTPLSDIQCAKRHVRCRHNGSRLAAEHRQSPSCGFWVEGIFSADFFFTVRLFRRAMRRGQIWWRKRCCRKFRRMESLTARIYRLAIVSPWEVSPKAVSPFEVQPWKFSPHEFFVA